LTPLLLTTTSTPAAGGGLGSFAFLGIMLVVFYLFILRPQRARVKAQQQLTSSLEVGDRVQTIGGIQGTIRVLDDDSAVLEVEQGRIRIVRRAISQKIDSVG
jgi:preprotein translocase subunit YajC